MAKSRQNQPFFSVIIPVYNEEKTIRACLRALSKQRLPPYHWETIVVDNNSTDRTTHIVKEYSVRLIHAEKQGLVMARHAGLQASRGEFIVNLDADCQPPPDWLKRYFDLLRCRPTLVFATGPYIPPPGEKNPVDWFNIALVGIIYRLFHRVICYWGGNVAIRKSALLAAGGYNLTNPYHDELSLLRRLNKLGEVLFDQNLRVISSNRRIHGRLWKFVLKEVLVLYLINNLYNRLTGKHLRSWDVIR